MSTALAPWQQLWLQPFWTFLMLQGFSQLLRLLWTWSLPQTDLEFAMFLPQLLNGKDGRSKQLEYDKGLVCIENSRPMKVTGYDLCLIYKEIWVWCYSPST